MTRSQSVAHFFENFRFVINQHARYISILWSHQQLLWTCTNKKCMHDFALKRIWSIKVPFCIKNPCFSYGMEHFKNSEGFGLFYWCIMIKNIPEQLMVVSNWGVSGLSKFEIIQSENFRLFFHTDWVLMVFFKVFCQSKQLYWSRMVRSNFTYTLVYMEPIKLGLWAHKSLKITFLANYRNFTYTSCTL